MDDNLDDLPIPYLILKAAIELTDGGKAMFTASELVVATWKLKKGAVGLEGFKEQHPDSNKVLSYLMGEKGLARRGWLLKTAAKTYSLTREGRKVFYTMDPVAAEEAPPAPANQRLTNDLNTFLRHVLSQPAVEKFEDGKKNDISFADACHLWRVHEGGRREVDDRLAEFVGKLEQLTQLAHQADIELESGRVLNPGDFRVLRNIHNHLLDKFSRHLTLLRERRDKGKAAS